MGHSTRYDTPSTVTTVPGSSFVDDALERREGSGRVAALVFGTGAAEEKNTRLAGSGGGGAAGRGSWRKCNVRLAAFETRRGAGREEGSSACLPPTEWSFSGEGIFQSSLGRTVVAAALASLLAASLLDLAAVAVLVVGTFLASLPCGNRWRITSSGMRNRLRSLLLGLLEAEASLAAAGVVPFAATSLSLRRVTAPCPVFPWTSATAAGSEARVQGTGASGNAERAVKAALGCTPPSGCFRSFTVAERDALSAQGEPRGSLTLAGGPSMDFLPRSGVAPLLSLAPPAAPPWIFCRAVEWLLCCPLLPLRPVVGRVGVR